ncbi:MAG: hypothetical protein KJZ87_23335 [Thermoguttaceae bacterium]|nr:hypothetical protein [Thermoguttaceae bacterium]
MKRTWLLSAVLMCPLLMLAQDVFSQYTPGGGAAPYQPAVPSSSEVYGGYGGYYDGGTTAAGSAMQGMASVVNAAGNYNLATSAAAICPSPLSAEEEIGRSAAPHIIAV